MEELYEYTDKLCGLKEKFTHALERASCDLESLSTDEAGKVVDIIKDLAQTEKYCMESCYYKTVIHAMHEGEGRYGYIGRARMDDPRRSWKYKQYKPFVYQEPYIFDYMDRMDHMPEYGGDRMGYPYPSYTNHTSPRMPRRNEEGNRYGRSYEEYKNAKRNYTTSNSPADKDEMNSHISEHVSDTLYTMRDMWNSADTALKKKIKADFTALLGEMNV